jgi:protein-disulfide isomerase
MSRKSKHSPPQPVNPKASTPAPSPSAARPTTPAQGKSRRNLFIAAVVALLLAFVAAALLYSTEQARSAQAAAAKNQPALASKESPTFGSPGARVHLVEFLDPACETCALFFPHVKKLLAANPDRLRLSVRHVPFHPGSELVVRILEAARKQDKYLPVMEALYADQRRWVVNHRVQADQVWPSLGGLGLDMDKLRNDMNAPEVDRRMAQDMGDARILGVTKTPEFFVNGRPLPSFGLEPLQDLVADELRRAYP